MSDSPRRGRPPRTSRDAIIDAVLELGIDRATTLAVAEHLGIDQSTLYRHISGRDEMRNAAAARAVEKVRWPETSSDPAAYLRAWSEALWTLFATSPGLARHMRNTWLPPEAFVHQAERVIRHVSETAHIPFAEAALIVDTIGDITADSFLSAEELETPTSSDAETTADRFTAHIEPFGSEAKDVLASAVGADAPYPGRTWWKDKVELILDGLAYRREHRERPTTDHPS